MKTTLKKPVALAIGAAMASSLAVASVAQAAPYSATDLAHGYSQFMGEGSCGGEKGKEGSCGGEKGKEGKCGEGKCGADKKPAG